MSEQDSVISRQAGRVIVIDPDERVLLLHGFDPQRPDEPYWITVGGGAKPGESLAEAAIRELREESGIVADPADLGEPVWHAVAEFPFDGRRYRQEEDFFALRVGSADVRTDGLEDEEAAVITGHRWWTIAELEATHESFFPAHLAALLRKLTARCEN
ncbi:MAG TPA: NUDIX domain-containing protein [Streptosporangiaceae bacterium]|nr:NUDIX domain-containing protein [Streptosporangiaceae bacterium]